MNVSPKARFLENEKLARQFLDIVDSEAFYRATELAMLMLLEEVERDKGPAPFSEIIGARRLIAILRSLPEPPAPLPPRPSHNLDHTLK